MKGLDSAIRATAWWLPPLVLALAALAWETDLGRAIRRLPPPQGEVAVPPVVAAMLPEFSIPGGPEAHAVTTERPLFTPNRRPAPPVPVAAATTQMQRGQFTLTGTLVIDGAKTAILREVANGKSRRVQEGETLNGLFVADVGTDRVKLKQGEEIEEILLRVATNSKPTVQPAAFSGSGAVPVAAAATAMAAGAPVVPPVPSSVESPKTVEEVRRELRRSVAAARSERAAAAEITGFPPEGEEPGNLVPPNLPPGITWDPKMDPYRTRWPTTPRK